VRADEESALEGQMKILARGTRQLGQQITNPAMQQSSVALLETLKKAASDSKDFEPGMTGEIPEAKRAAFLADFRTDLDELKDAFDRVENGGQGRRLFQSPGSPVRGQLDQERGSLKVQAGLTHTRHFHSL